MSDMTISRLGAQGMLAIRTDLAAAGDRIADALGLPVPAPLRASAGEGADLLWFSPDELLLLCPAAALGAQEKALTLALQGDHALIADVSDMRAGFTLAGPRLREVLAKLVPFDLHPDGFRPGDVRRTHLGQVAAAIWMIDSQTARIFCFRSVADYVQTCLTTAADPAAAVGLTWSGH